MKDWRADPLCGCRKCEARRLQQVREAAEIKYARDAPKRVAQAKVWLDEIALGTESGDKKGRVNLPRTPNVGDVVRLGGRRYLFDGFAWRSMS